MSQEFLSFRALPVHIAPHVIDSIPIPMVCFTNKFEILYFNAAFATYMGMQSDATAVALKATDIMSPQQDVGFSLEDALHEAVVTARNHGSFHGLWRLKAFDGEERTAQLSMSLPKNGEEEYVLCYFTPTMESVNAVTGGQKSLEDPVLSEEALVHLNHVTQTGQGNKYLYKTSIHKEYEQDLMETLPFIMHIWSKDLKLIDCSAEVTKVFGVADKAEFKHKFFSLCPEIQLGRNSQTLMQEYLQKAFHEGFCKFKWLHSDVQGKLLPCEVTLSRISHAGEECVLGYTQDLSSVSRHVQEFAKVQESTRAMLDAAPMAVTLWDNNYLLRDANSECARLFGFRDSEEFMKYFRNIIPRFQEDGTSSFSTVKNALGIAFAEGFHRSNFSLYHGKTRALIPLEITLVRLTVWNEVVVVGYIRDLRDIKSLIQKMQTTEERIQTIFDITPLGVNVWDKNYNLIECNEAIVQLYGFENKEEYIAKRFRVMPRLQPDGTPTVPFARECIEHCFVHGYSHAEMLTQDVHGNPIPVEVVFKKAYLQQQEVVISYVRDVRELKAKLAEIHAAEQELRTARDMAEQSAQTKTTFLGNMTHEIRTPLNGVLGLLHVLDETALQPTQKEYVAKSIASAHKLVALVNNVLDFSKIDAGTFEMETEPFTLKEIADEVQIVFAPQATAKDIAFTVYTDATSEDTLYGDGARLKQVISNVLGNAIKFTEAGHITLNITCTQKQEDEIHYLFSVEDSGIGMTKAQSMQVFSAFAQADSSITRKYEGAGLGLAIAKRITKLMNGDMWVKSVKDKGSTFYFTAVFKGERKAGQTLLASSVDAMALSHTGTVQVPMSQGGNVQVQGLLGTILLAEDNEINQLITVELLKNKGYVVDVATNGKEAVRMVKEKAYDMVLMDIQMPIMDGLTATTKIRSLNKFAHLPIVAMSAHAMSGDKELSLQHGMNDHLSKPIIPALLYESVEKWCKKDT